MLINKTIQKEMTWAEIKAAAENGTVRELLSSGDRIPVTLKTGERVEFDVAYDQKGKLYFVMHDCMAQRRQMNRRATNKGGWAKTALRKEANGEIFDSLPDDLQAVIVPTRIVQVIDGERIVCNDKLFCLSFTQIFGRLDDWEEMQEMEPEDTQLDIFTDGRSRVKQTAGAVCYWWERSPNVYNSYYFYSVYTSGSPSYYSYAGNSFGVCLGFCITES